MDLGNLLDSMIFGNEVEYEGKKYQHIQTLSNGHILVIKSGEKMPAQTYVILKPEKELTDKDSK